MNDFSNFLKSLRREARQLDSEGREDEASRLREMAVVLRRRGIGSGELERVRPARPYRVPIFK